MSSYQILNMAPFTLAMFLDHRLVSKDASFQNFRTLPNTDSWLIFEILNKMLT